jgi:stearoyl-CoA desaturase (delta-9 desaturase)
MPPESSPSSNATSVEEAPRHSPAPILRRRVRSPADTRLRVINSIAVVLPFAGLVAAICLLWGVAFDWTYLLILWGMSMVTALGVTVGYHRLCTHKSFKVPGVVRYALAAAGSMAVQGPVIRWCAEHRRHHQHSDTTSDPHSPHMSPEGSWGNGLWATLRGALHAHVGWLFAGHSKALGKYSRDLREDRVLVMVDRQFPLWVLAGLLIPSVLGGLLTWSWMGLLLGFLWGGLVRVLLVHHITWSVNSICHLWGTQPFDCHDESRNNVIVGLLGMGEGWHNNHHAFPSSARHGLRWWEFDVSYIFIRGLQTVGLASAVRRPDRERIAAKLRSGAKGQAGVSVSGHAAHQ